MLCSSLSVDLENGTQRYCCTNIVCKHENIILLIDKHFISLYCILDSLYKGHLLTCLPSDVVLSKHLKDIVGLAFVSNFIFDQLESKECGLDTNCKPPLAIVSIAITCTRLDKLSKALGVEFNNEMESEPKGLDRITNRDKLQQTPVAQDLSPDAFVLVQR